MFYYLIRLTASLLNKLNSTYNLEKVDAVQCGIVHESTAIESYKNIGGEVSDTGLWT